MRRATAAVSALLVLAAAPAAQAQLAATKFFNLVDTPASITYSASGQAQVIVDPSNGGTVDLTGYHTVYLRIGKAKATGFSVNMGKIKNSTLSQMFTGTITNQIRSFEVKGPEMVLWLTGGPPNTTDTVQLWVYVTS